MRSRRLNYELNDDPSRWVISYADFITLLFAFFVVMYAISNVNVKKYKALASSVTGAFSSKKVGETEDVSARGNDKEMRSIIPSITMNKPTVEKNKRSLFVLGPKLHQLNSRFFSIRSYDGWYELEVNAKDIFVSGQSEPSQKAIYEFERLAGILKGQAFPIAVEGFTDSEPIHTAEFPSNWELSAMRAAAVARILVTSGVSPSQVSAIGFASRYPIADNSTEKGRARNRRVVLVVAENTDVKRLLNPAISLESNKEELPAYLRKKTQIKFIKKVKEIRTKSGGIKFIQSIEEEKQKDKK